MLKQADERTCDKGFFTKDMHALVCLNALLSFICRDSIERNTPKNFWWCAAVFCCFLRLRLIGKVMSAEAGPREDM